MFIKDLLCISPQLSYNFELFKSKPLTYSGNKYFAIEPDYKELIPTALLRRMGKITRMGVGAGLPLLFKHSNIQGIIIGTTDGGISDSMNFLKQIEQYNEGTLTPTNFIQSTPNSLAGLLSMMSNNSSYNNTHVHEGLSFENALLDAQMLIEEYNAPVLVGAAEEICEWNYNINLLKGQYKKEVINSSNLIVSNTTGTVCGEGAAMFVVDKSPENALAHIIDVSQIISNKTSDIVDKINFMFQKNNIKSSDIDTLIFGLNGNIDTDHIYFDVYNKLFDNQGIVSFKNLSGDYPTATAFALWLAICIMNGYNIFSDIIIKKPISEIHKILIYNNYKGLQHSIMMISK